MTAAVSTCRSAGQGKMDQIVTYTYMHWLYTTLACQSETHQGANCWKCLYSSRRFWSLKSKGKKETTCHVVVTVLFLFQTLLKQTKVIFMEIFQCEWISFILWPVHWSLPNWNIFFWALTSVHRAVKVLAERGNYDFRLQCSIVLHLIGMSLPQKSPADDL